MERNLQDPIQKFQSKHVTYTDTCTCTCYHEHYHAVYMNDITKCHAIEFSYIRRFPWIIQGLGPGNNRKIQGTFIHHYYATLPDSSLKPMIACIRDT